MKDDVIELIVDALTGKCLKCKGRGYITGKPSNTGVWVYAREIGSAASGVAISTCEACGGTGEA